MAETVNVASSPGANYTWANGKFAWSSATAGKNWTSAYPAVYTLNVSTDLGFAELSQKLGIKQTFETFGFAEKQGKSVVMNKFEAMNFVETYTDLIAFVLRFVESFGMAEKYGLSNTKQVFEAFQVSEGLARQIALRKFETIAMAETYTDLIAFFLRVGESFSFIETPAKVLTKPQTESFSFTEGLTKSQLKRFSEAFVFAEVFGRTVAYRKSISEGFAISEAMRRAQTLKLSEALSLAEQYRRRANGVISDMIVASTEITEQDFMDILESGHNHDAAYAALGHNHNATYLGITAKAADADKLDGYDSTAFVRSVNGVGPDANGNSSIPIDLSSRVAKSGDTMSGTLTVPRLQIASTANYLDMVDQDWGTRYLHHNQGLMGFLKSDGNWDMYMNNSGQMWTANYGWLHDYFFSSTGNCVRQYQDPWNYHYWSTPSVPNGNYLGGNTGNCHPGWTGVINCYGIAASNGALFVHDRELIDNGSQIYERVVRRFFNCACNCDCTCC